MGNTGSNFGCETDLSSANVWETRPLNRTSTDARQTGLTMPTRSPAAASKAAKAAKPAATRDTAQSTTRAASARERIDHTAYELFSRRGVRGVGVDELIARSGVAKMTLYRHYRSKDELALAFLRRREELWTRGWLQAEVERREESPGDKLLAIFDIFDKWFRRSDFEGCSFINVLLETESRDHPVRLASVGHLAAIREFLKQLARSAGVREPDAFARQWHILMKGAIVAAGEGDKEAAQRARELGRLLLASEGIASEDSAIKTRATIGRSTIGRSTSGKSTTASRMGGGSKDSFAATTSPRHGVRNAPSRKATTKPAR